jgi:hypothetical protein
LEVAVVEITPNVAVVVRKNWMSPLWDHFEVLSGFKRLFGQNAADV